MLLRSSQVGGGRTACPQFAVGDPFQLEIDDYFTIGLNACGPPVVGFKGVMRGVKEDTITPGAEKSQQCHKYFLQCSTFTSERSQVRTWGRQTCFLPRAPSNLVTPLLHWHGSIPETGFWLCKLPKSCVSYKFSIAFLLYCLLLFLSKLPSSITNELVKNICTQLSDKSRTVLTKATAFVIAEQF